MAGSKFFDLNDENMLFRGRIIVNMPLTPVPGESAVCHVRGFSLLGRKHG